jgi:hypothetical protein
MAPEMRASWSARGREHAAAFTWRAAAHRLLEVLESLEAAQDRRAPIARREAA